MRNKRIVIFLTFIFSAGSISLPFLLPMVFAHCDTLDGPVVADARLALEKRDVTPVLKWVQKERELEISQAFEQALDERRKGPAAREAADMRFFEALVKIHRAGEGASFTGLKPVGTELGPAVKEADRGLRFGSVDTLISLVTEDAAGGIRRRFIEALEKSRHKDESVEAGREFVAAYIEYIHYVERLHQDALGQGIHHGGSEGSGAEERYNY